MCTFRCHHCRSCYQLHLWHSTPDHITVMLPLIHPDTQLNSQLNPLCKLYQSQVVPDMGLQVAPGVWLYSGIVSRMNSNTVYLWTDVHLCNLHCAPLLGPRILHCQHQVSRSAVAITLHLHIYGSFIILATTVATHCAMHAFSSKPTSSPSPWLVSCSSK